MVLLLIIYTHICIHTYIYKEIPRGLGTISKTPVAQRLMSLVRVSCHFFSYMYSFDGSGQMTSSRQTTDGRRQQADGRLSVRSVCCFHFVSRYPTSPSVGDVASDFISLLETPASPSMGSEVCLFILLSDAAPAHQLGGQHSDSSHVDSR